MTDLIYPKVSVIDDACDWTNVIIWRMNAGARACSRSVFVRCPNPVPVAGIRPKFAPAIKVAKEKKAAISSTAKTHTATVIFADGEKTVEIRETATAWTAGSKLNFDKVTGQRAGVRGRCRMLLDTIKPIEKQEQVSTNGEELSAQKLVAIMMGKKLSHQGILIAIAKFHPDIKITAHQVQKRVAAMLRSNLVGIIQHDETPIPHFTLQSADPRFYVHSKRNMG